MLRRYLERRSQADADLVDVIMAKQIAERWQVRKF